jgi:hypothetical protein
VTAKTEPISNLFIGPKASQIQELFEPAPGSIAAC